MTIYDNIGHVRKGVFFTIFMILVGLTLFSASTPSLQQQGVIRYVNNTGPTCGGQSPCYTTIQAAVNAVLPGEIIQIQAGSYPEKVTISGKNNTSNASETDRIIIEADPQAPLGSVIVTGSTQACTNGYAFRLQQSKFITLRGLTITGTGGQAIELMGGNNQNHAIHIERNRIFGNGSSECNGGITIARGNPDTLIVNNLIYDNGRNGIATIDADGGPHYIVNNTIHSNQWSGVRVTRTHEVYLVNNAVTQNGVASGSTGGRFGVSREGSTSPQPEGIHLLNNLICGNRLGEIDGPALDSTDSGNLTPAGTEGSGVSASPGCEMPGNVYANVNGADGLSNTADDDFSLASTSPAIDRGMDPRSLGLNVLLNPIFEANFLTEGVRPTDGNSDGTAGFDIGAFEFVIPNQPPVVNVGQNQTINEGTLVNLDGTLSFDSDGNPITFEWSQIAGPTVLLSNPSSPTPTFTAPQVDADTILAFQLLVSDGLLNSSATVNVTVTNVAPPNHPPVLNPIGNKTVAPGSTLSFTVTGSDPDGDPLTFSAEPLPANGTFDSTGSFTFTPDSSQAGSFSLTFSVTDGRGGSASETMTITVTTLNIAITEPMDGATVQSGSLLVRGTVEAGGAEVGVALNGFPALINGKQWAVEIPIGTGNNLLSATATMTSGTQTSTSIGVTAFEASSNLVLLRAVPSNGVAPLKVKWEAINQTGRALVQFEFDDTGSGTFGPPTTTFSGVETTYTSRGLLFPRLQATDDQGATYTAIAIVNVEDPQTVTTRFQALWTSFKARLKANDLPGTLAHLVPTFQSRFQSIFEQLRADLPAIVAGFGNLEVLEQAGDLAEAVIVQHENGVPMLYFVYFRRDSLGRWLIEEM